MLDSNKNKFYLLILPLLVIYLVYFYIDSNKEIKTYKFFNNNKTAKNINFIEVNKEIENYLNKNKIELISMTNSKKQIDLKVLIKDSQISKFLNMIEYLNDYSKIKKLVIDKVNKSSRNRVDLVIEFKKQYIKNKEEKAGRKEKSEIKYRLKAIVHNHVLINNKWYSNNQKIDNYQIEIIGFNSIKLKNKSKEIILKVYHEK